jgi:hypothetical protein
VLLTYRDYRPETIGVRVVLIVNSEVRIILFVCVDLLVHPVGACPAVAYPMVYRIAVDEGFGVPLVAVVEKSHKALLVINFAIGGDYHPWTLMCKSS